jgi:hypothetical protein
MAILKGYREGFLSYMLAQHGLGFSVQGVSHVATAA